MRNLTYKKECDKALFSNNKPWMYKEPMIDLIETLEEYNVAFDIQEKDDFSLRFWIYDGVYKEFYLECCPWITESVYNLVNVITAMYDKDKKVDNGENEDSGKPYISLDMDAILRFCKDHYLSVQFNELAIDPKGVLVFKSSAVLDDRYVTVGLSKCKMGTNELLNIIREFFEGEA